MLIDCCIFDNEYAMLALRLRVLSPVVDRFVIVEGDHTFQGAPKPHTSQEFWRERFGQYGDRLRVVRAYMDEPADMNPWRREAMQRNSALFGLQDAEPSDVVMLSDIDEVPSREAIAVAMGGVPHSPFVLVQQTLFYGMWWRREENGSSLWGGTVFSTVEEMRRRFPQVMRDVRHNFKGIRDGGWHFTSFGGVEQVRHKLQSFAHVECNRPEFLGDVHLANCIRQGLDPCGFHDVTVQAVGEDFYPDYVLEAAKACGWMEVVPA